MASHLLGGQDGFLDRRQGADLTQLAELHVLESLGILGQAHVAHAALNIVHKPALAKHDNDGDVLASDVACVFQHLAARHDVFADFLALDLLLAHLTAADGHQGFF